MTLTTRIITRISIALLIVMAIWATVFYFIIIEEINDETDDTLEDYSEYIIKRSLAGEDLPDRNNGTNNNYYIIEVPYEYTLRYPAITYFDEDVYIEAKKETEPARVLKTIFRDRHDRYYELRVAIPTIEKSDLQEAILIWIIVLYFLLLLVVIITNWWILRKSFRPLYGLLKWLDNFRVEKGTETFALESDVPEFRKLQDAMFRSARRNIETFEQQKLFIGNASHELQTPLAICRNRLEVLMNQDEMSEAQLGEIYKIKQSIEYLVRLNKTLLLLTKIENNQYPDAVVVDVNSRIKEYIELYSEIYAEKKVRISIHEDAQAKVEMNEELSSILFNNLLKNAYIHNCEGGDIDVLISSHCVEISNGGNAEPLNPQKVFDRFQQNHRKENSTGLGLALVKSVCDYYKMDVRYRFVDGRHIFSVFI